MTPRRRIATIRRAQVPALTNFARAYLHQDFEAEYRIGRRRGGGVLSRRVRGRARRPRAGDRASDHDRRAVVTRRAAALHDA